MFTFLTIAAASLAIVDTPADGASESNAHPFNGTYNLSDRHRAKKAVIEGIDRTVSKMFFAKRPIARKLLKSANPVLDQVHFTIDGDKVHYAYDGHKNIDGVMGDPFKPWRSPEDNKTYKVKKEQKGDTIVQTIQGQDGTKQETFSLSADGKTLTYAVKITSPQLPEPLNYAYDFKRR